MAKSRTAPGWAIALRDWAKQTSTRSGLVFVAISAAGYSLTEDEITAIVAVAGAVAALIALVFPDRPAK
jgi:hypothetical protein